MKKQALDIDVFAVSALVLGVVMASVCRADPQVAPSHTIAYLQNCEERNWTAWDADVWSAIEPLPIDQFHPRSHEKHLTVEVKIGYDATALYLVYRVRDEYVLANHTEPQTTVSQDSCVEFFVQPTTFGGYFNFEINCIGTVLAHYRPNMMFVMDNSNSVCPLDSGDIAQLTIVPSLKKVAIPEQDETVTWTLALRIPFDVLEQYTGPLQVDDEALWHANFYKCAAGSSRPHWASWAPIGQNLDFHVPERFGTLRFDSRETPDSTTDDAQRIKEGGQS